MARLLVSVRTADEARAAVTGGADIVDVKEPAAGPLGCADPRVWRAIREIVPGTIPLSAALGEAVEWIADSKPRPAESDWFGVSFAKMGLSRSGSDWLEGWESIRSRFERELPPDCRWVAVVYADWQAAGAPHPDRIITAALAIPRCCGVLIDTWEKDRRVIPPDDPGAEWRDRVDRIQRDGRFCAWAGGVDVARIERFRDSGFAPDVVAVRGAACRGGDRLGPIETARVARIREAAASLRDSAVPRAQVTRR